jgi:LmbE family N-acetylglucosaminyl deacetylase
MTQTPIQHVAIIVAHPDDETLWAGGTIRLHPTWRCFVACLCRRSDQERANRFYQVLTKLKAVGAMGDLDDGPDQHPLPSDSVEGAILALLPPRPFDLLITHNPTGEYTKHRRHEEVSRAVINLWNRGQIAASALWTFAYEDGDRAYLPRADPKATSYHVLAKQVWKEKHKLITKTYGFDNNSWEATTTPRAEAFWQFANPAAAQAWVDDGGILRTQTPSVTP